MRILAFGHFGGRNFGDELMLTGLLTGLRDEVDISLTVATPNGALPLWVRSTARAVPMKAFRLMSALQSSDVLLVCGGTSFHDAFPPSRHRKFRLNLILLTSLYVTARLLGKKVLLIGIGVGPLVRPLTRLLARIAFSSAAAITVRDQQSWDELAELIGPQKIELTHDLALLALQKRACLENIRTEIVICLVPPTSVSTADVGDAAEFIERAAELMGKFVREDQRFNIRIAVTSVGPSDNDLDISRTFAASVEQTSGKPCELSVFDGDPRKYLAMLADSALVIAMRFHTAVAATLLGTPTIWLPYQRKVIDGAVSLGVPCDYIIVPAGGGAAQKVYEKAKILITSGASVPTDDLARAFALARRNIEVIRGVGV